MLQLLLRDLTKAKENYAEKDWTAEMNVIARNIQDLKEQLAEHLKQRLEINRELDEKYGPEIGFLRRRIERSNDVHAQKLKVSYAYSFIAFTFN